MSRITQKSAAVLAAMAIAFAGGGEAAVDQGNVAENSPSTWNQPPTLDEALEHEFEDEGEAREEQQLGGRTTVVAR